MSTKEQSHSIGLGEKIKEFPDIRIVVCDYERENITEGDLSQLITLYHPEKIFEMLIYKIRKIEDIQVNGHLNLIAGGKKMGCSSGSKSVLFKIINSFDPHKVKFNGLTFLYYRPAKENKVFMSDTSNHMIRSLSVSFFNQQGRLICPFDDETKKASMKSDIYKSGSCSLNYPSGLDWDIASNMYISGKSCIYKIDSMSGQLSMIAGHEFEKEHRDGVSDEARFDNVEGILCYQQDMNSDIVLYVCDFENHCIRKINCSDGQTLTYAGKGKQCGDTDGDLQSARFYFPCDIISDEKVFYISDYYNHKIRTIDLKEGIVKTLVGNCIDKSVLNYPRQIQTIGNFIYVACSGDPKHITSIHKKTKQVIKIPFKTGSLIGVGVWGITYYPPQRCFMISDGFALYRLE